MSNSSSYDQLIQRLDAFIRKFYVNKILKGTLYFIALVAILFLCLSLMESRFYFSKPVRKVMFYGSGLVTVLALGYWVVMPLLKYFRLGKVISHENAAQIIGEHFPSVEDKLINILQLKKEASAHQSHDLLYAGIEQKMKNIKLLPFKKAIDLGQNRKYIKYAAPPLLIILMLMWAAPSVLKDSTYRLVNNDVDFEKPAPFGFELEDFSTDCVQFSDYKINAKVVGDVLPKEAFVVVNGFEYRMNEDGHFNYTVQNVQDDFEFFIKSGDVTSQSYNVNVLHKANLVDIKASINYPRHTGRRSEVIENAGDLLVPEGSTVQWNIQTNHTSKVQSNWNHGSAKNVEQVSNGSYSLKKQLRQSGQLTLLYGNEEISNLDSSVFQMQVIKDAYPQISLKKFADSTRSDIMFYAGEINDDYGIKALQLYTARGPEDVDPKSLSFTPKALPIDDGLNFQTFQHTLDTKDLNLKPGENLYFYFEVTDNDAINGFKRSKTGIKQYRKPSIEELELQEEANEDKILEKLSSALKKNKNIKAKARELMEQLLQEKEVDWQHKKQLESLQEEHQKLQEELEKAKSLFEENKENDPNAEQKSEEETEKEEKLEELFEEAMNDKAQELMEKIQELMEKLKREDSTESLDEMLDNNEESQMQLERLEELYKKLLVESEVMEQAEKLDELAKEQEELSNELKEGTDNKEAQEKQKEIQEKFKKIDEQLKKTEKQNEELSRPLELPDNRENASDAKQNMQESQQQMQNSQSNKAKKSMKKSAKAMKKMSSGMRRAMQDNKKKKDAENAKTLRQILENLVTLSYDEEKLIDDLSKTSINTPAFGKLVQQQNTNRNNFKIVQDSLEALGKRVFEIESFVTTKVGEINKHYKNSIKQLADRRKSSASNHQRRTMTNLNDLSLMLSDALENMQQNMSGSSSMCNKPGGGSGKSGPMLDKITKGQQKLNQEMLDKLGAKNDKKGKEDKEGEAGKDGKGKPSSEDFGRMAEKQAELRRALREKQKQLREQGKGSKSLENILKKMDETETDLVNKKLTREMLKRQQEILTRLLEAEKAERQQGEDKKREAKKAEEKFRTEMPPALKAYLKEREAEIQPVKKLSPGLNPFYKKMVEKYYQRLKKQ